MPGTLWMALVVTVAAVPVAIFIQDRYKNQSPEEERGTCFEQRERRMIEAGQLKQQITQLKEKQHESDRESCPSSEKFAALEETIGKLVDERTAWDDERERLLLRQKQLRQQYDQRNDKLQATESDTTEAWEKIAALEEDLEKLEDERTAWSDERERLLVRQKQLTQQYDQCSDKLKATYSTAEEYHGYKAYPVLIKQLKTKAALQENYAIDGITILNEDILASSIDRNVVERFDSSTLSTKQPLLLTKFKNQITLRICSVIRTRFILVGDYIYTLLNRPTSKTILIVDLYSAYILQIWAVDSCTRTFSLTEDCHVVTTCPDKNKINEYSTTGHMIREIVLDSVMDIKRPYLALKMTNGNFLVSYEKSARQRGFFLSVLNSNGDVLKSYSDGSKDKELVIDMVVDRKGNILVAEMYKGRVILLDSNLEYTRELVSRKNGIRFILALLLDEINGRLFVSECNYMYYGFRSEKCVNGQIMVFDVL